MSELADIRARGLEIWSECERIRARQSRGVPFTVTELFHLGAVQRDSHVSELMLWAATEIEMLRANLPQEPR